MPMATQNRNAWEKACDEIQDLILRMEIKPGEVIRTCNMQWHRLKLGMLTLGGRVERSVAEHEAVAGAILAGRPAEARKAMETHLQNLKRELVKIMQLLHYPTI